MADDKSHAGAVKQETASSSTVGQKEEENEGFLSRIWNGIFRLHGDDFEKRLQYIYREEALTALRMKKRSLHWRHMSRHIIVSAIILEVLAVSYAITATSTTNLNWKTRALKISPMFLFPALSCAAYSAFMNFYEICDRKDQKTLERLQAERQAKLDELKERTNYYSTQQLIQRYDTDPAAKAAATSVLASRLGLESGLEVFVRDKSKLNFAAGNGRDGECTQSVGLRNRRDCYKRSSSTGSIPTDFTNEESTQNGVTEDNASYHNKTHVDPYQPPGPVTNIGGWLARIATLLVGEDPTQCYAIICSNCHMHNGLARKEDFSYITYYCPHCQALNMPKQSVLSSELIPKGGTSGEEANNTSSAVGGSIPAGENPVPAGAKIEALLDDNVPHARGLVKAMPMVEGHVDDDLPNGHDPVKPTPEGESHVDDDVPNGPSPVKATPKIDRPVGDSVPRSRNSPVNSTCDDSVKAGSEIESLDHNPLNISTEIQTPMVETHSVPTGEN